jgi:hypothetical protein
VQVIDWRDKKTGKGSSSGYTGRVGKLGKRAVNVVE